MASIFGHRRGSQEEKASKIMHPYVPRDADIRDYSENVTNVWVLVSSFAYLLFASVSVVVYLSTRLNRQLSRTDLCTIAWFALCGSVHCAFEAYLLLNYASIPSSQSLFAQLWKEYALSDSRYLTGDAALFALETITVLVIGPLCWATILAIVRQYPSRHALQAIVCTSYLFSVSVYYATGSLSSVSHCRPEPLYLYVYYVGLNSPWVFVPAILLVQSVRRITSDARTLHRIRQAPVFSDIRRLVEEGAPKPRHVRNAASDGSGTEGKKAV